MQDMLIFFGVGLFCFVAGILLLKREKRLFGQKVNCTGTVVGYDEYQSTSSQAGHRINMYTLLVEYTNQRGELIRAKEQSGTSRRKYEIGTAIPVTYSLEKEDMFVVTGDKSRYIAFWGMIIVGGLMMVAAVFMAIS